MNISQNNQRTFRLGLATLWLVLMFGGWARAQQPYYQWRIGVGVGAMAYYGDLSYRFNTTQINFPAYSLYVEKKVTPSLGIQLNGTYGKISGNDRSQDWKGNLITTNPNFSRALNFQTDVRTASLVFNYHFDNGKILSEYATFAPYIFAGVGVTNFTVYGDLYGADGGRYYYWSDNTVRSRPPGSGANAPVIEQDGKYETKLTGLNTEQSYPTTVFSIPVGLGLKIKLSDQLSAGVQFGATYAFTDHLDDVSGNYRGSYDNEAQAYAANPSGVIRQPRGDGKSNNDWYFSSAVTLSYHFGYKRKSFTPPLVYTGYKGTPAAASQVASKPSANPLQKIQPTGPDTLKVARDSVNLPDVARKASRNNLTNDPATRSAYRDGSVNGDNAEETEVLDDADEDRVRSYDRYGSSSYSENDPQYRDREPQSRYYRNGTSGRYAYDQNYATSTPPRYVAPAPPVYETTRTSPLAVAPVIAPGVGVGQHNGQVMVVRDTAEVNQLRRDLQDIKTQLAASNASKNTTSGGQLDSLVTALDSLNTDSLGFTAAQSGNNLASLQNLLDAQKDNSNLSPELRRKLDGLSRSLADIQKRLRTMENPPGVLAGYSTTVYYEINKADLRPSDRQRLAVLASKLKADPNVRLNVKGFTDQTGNAQYNLFLSQRRAENVVNYLTQDLGIDPGRIVINYYGQTGASAGNRNNPYQRKVELELFLEK